MKNVLQIPEKYCDLFGKRALAYLTTLMPDGTPQVTPVWVDYDGQYLLVNTARGRQKDLNMMRNPSVALTVQDPDDPYRHLDVRGKVVAAITDGASEHIDTLARKYTGADYFNHQPGEIRVIYKIEPLHVSK